ncbi:MAG: hypothetical protein AAFR98_12875 [Pseudomonadota bacterium]
MNPAPAKLKVSTMARSFYEARNRFVLNSKMDEKIFLAWLNLYLRGISVSEATRKFDAIAAEGQRAPSAKTITNLFRRMGRYMFHTSFEPFLWESTIGGPQKFLDRGLDAYQTHLDDVAHAIIDEAKSTISLDQFHILAASQGTLKTHDRIALEVRALLVARKGVSDPRADVGLAYMRALTPGGLPRNQNDAQHITKMLEFVSEKMLSFPMDEDGNTYHYLNYNPEKVNYNQYGAFEKKYWATHGIWIEDWKTKRAQQIKKPKFGYIRTCLDDQTYEAQRAALEAQGCSRIYADMHASSEIESWREFFAMLSEASEHATMIISDIAGWQPIDENWRDAHIALYKSPADILFLVLGANGTSITDKLPFPDFANCEKKSP